MTVTQMTDQQPGPMVVQRTPMQQLVAEVRHEQIREQIAAALPPTVPVSRFERALITALMDDVVKQTDAKFQLVNADRPSLFQAVVKCAQDGLMPDGKQAALVVYGGKVQYLPMIGGVRQIAAEFGWTIRTHVAYSNDLKFEVVEGTNESIDHRPAPPGTDRGELVAAYAIAHHRDGRRSIFEVMYEADVMKAKAVAKTDKIWKGWPAQMWEKTVGHRIAKKLPLDPMDAQRMRRVVDAVELGPEESAAALYGPGARASFSELPSGTQPYVDSPSEVPPVDAPADTEPAVTPPAEPGNPSGSSDTPTEASTEAQPSGAPVAAAAPLPEPDEEAVMLAAEAAEFVPTFGRFSDGGSNGPLDLAAILDLGDDGLQYLTMLLTRLEPGVDRSATEAFARVHMPAEYAAHVVAVAKAA